MVLYQALTRIFGGIREKQAIDFKRSGRGDWIRTNGLLVPNQARYQAALRPDMG